MPSDITLQKICISCKKEVSLPKQAQCKTCRQISSKKNYSKRKDRIASDKDCQIAALKKSLIKKDKKIAQLLGKINRLIYNFRG